MGVTVKCERGIVALYIVICDYIVVISRFFFNSAACMLYVGCRSVVFICLSAVKPEQKNTKQNNWTWLEGLLTIREYLNLLEKGKLVVCGAYVACVVSHRYPILIIFGIMQEYCRRLLVLPDTFMYTTFIWISVESLVASNRRLLLRLRRYIDISASW